MKKDEAHTIDCLLSYIAEREGDEFDHDRIAKQLHLKRKKLFRYLYQLELAGKIVAVQNKLRKPILITEDDYRNFFWKVFLASEEHPHSELGRLDR